MVKTVQSKTALYLHVIMSDNLVQEYGCNNC